MSNALAIAAVSAVLKDLLDNALIDHSVSAAVGDSITVTALAPDRLKNEGEEKTQLNLFLYHVTPNLGWRNVDLPSRGGRGQRLANPPLAIDLFYLLTAIGKNDFDAEILLGYAMQLLHEMPVLTRDAIRETLEPDSPVDGDDLLPSALGALAASDLADQVELVKLTPQPMSTEEISKLWAAFQTNYRPSVAYRASVVLIESRLPARSPLPVLTRGEPDQDTGRDAGITAQPGLIPPYPTLQAATPPDRQTAVRMGEDLTLTGHHLGATQVTVEFTHVRSSETLALPALAGATASEVHVQIPPDPPSGPVAPDSPQNPDNWRAGVYSVAAVLQDAGGTARTNELVLALAPRVESATAGAAGGIVTLTVTCSPKVWKGQRVTLVVGEREIAAEPITAGKVDTLQFKAGSALFPGGDYWIRLRVDGVESILVDRSKRPPAFDPSQEVTIP